MSKLFEEYNDDYIEPKSKWINPKKKTHWINEKKSNAKYIKDQNKPFSEYDDDYTGKSLNKLEIAKSLIREAILKSLDNKTPDDISVKTLYKNYKRSIRGRFPSSIKHQFDGPEHLAKKAMIEQHNTRDIAKEKKRKMIKSLIREAIYNELGIEKGLGRNIATAATIGALTLGGNHIGANIAKQYPKHHSNPYIQQLKDTSIKVDKEVGQPAYKKSKKFINSTITRAKPLINELGKKLSTPADQVLIDPKQLKKLNTQAEDNVLSALRSRGIKNTDDIKKEIKKRGMTQSQVENKIRKMGYDPEYVKKKIRSRL